MANKNMFSNKIFPYSVFLIVAVAIFAISVFASHRKPIDRTVFDDIQPASAEDFIVEKDEDGKYVLTKYIGIDKFVVMPEKLNLPEGADEYSIAVIGKGAFANSDIRGIKLSDAVVGIQEDAFANCADLKVIIGGNAFSVIGDRAFYNCPLLSYVYFPVCTEIGESAFENDKNIERFYFPIMLTSVGNNAFKNTSLTNIAGYDEGYAKEYCESNNICFVEYNSLEEKIKRAYEGYEVEFAVLEESLQESAWEVSETDKKE